MGTCVNGLRELWRKEDACAVREEFRSLHETEQQTVLRNLVQILEEAAGIYNNGETDHRNLASCRWAAELLMEMDREKINLNFPHI